MSDDTYADFIAASNGIPLGERVVGLVRGDVQNKRFNDVRQGNEVQFNAIRSEVAAEITVG